MCLRAGLLTALLALFLSACSAPEESAGPRFHADRNPPRLSDWGLFSVASGALQLSDGVVPYDLNTPLFTDYAHKLRTVWMPPGRSAGWAENGPLDFPVGTVISKTFYYPLPGGSGAAFDGRVSRAGQVSGRMGEVLETLARVRLVETRLMVRREAGWEAVAYVWNADQSDAVLTRIGAVVPMTLVEAGGAERAFNYIVPSVNQCAACHATNNTTRVLHPIGPAPRHLNKAHRHGGKTVNQLTRLQEVGYLDADAPVAAARRHADWTDSAAPPEARVSAYLDANCAHCHNPVGPADMSGLYLDPQTPMGPARGLCKLSIAAGSGTGGRKYGIVPGSPDDSIFLYRMESTEPDEMMPELGRSLVHEEAVALIRAWIAQMEGDCG